MTKRLLTLLLGLIVVLALWTRPGFAQPGDELKALRKEIETLKEGQATIRKDLEAIKDFLRGRQAVPLPETPDILLTVAGHPFKGDKHATLTLIEFSDYQCPFCARHFRETLPQIEKDYIQTGKIKYVFRDFPIESIHRDAVKAAEAARCAGDQGKYWEMHDRLFSNQNAPGLEQLSRHAEAIGLSVAKFEECLDTLKYAGEVRESVAEGLRVGVSGTPTFFLGLTGPEGKVKALSMIRGAQRYPVFKERIDVLLSSPER